MIDATAIREFRRKKGLKQEAFAELLGVDTSTVSRWERGRDRPNLAIAQRLHLMLMPTESAVDAALRMFAASHPGRVALYDTQGRTLASSAMHAKSHQMTPDQIVGMTLDQVPVPARSLKLMSQLPSRMLGRQQEVSMYTSTYIVDATHYGQPPGTYISRMTNTLITNASQLMVLSTSVYSLAADEPSHVDNIVWTPNLVKG